MSKYRFGNFIPVILVGINVILWLVVGPRDDGRPMFLTQFVAEMFSSSAVILFAFVLLLTNRPHILEGAFGGLDRMYQTKKNTAIIAVIFICIHELIMPTSGPAGPGLWLGEIAFGGFIALVLVTVGPRVPILSSITQFTYAGWRRVHRFMGLFYILGVLHMTMVQPILFNASPILVYYVEFMEGVGITAYLYKELLWGKLQKRHGYSVEVMKRLNISTIELTLKPQGERLQYRAGQFLFIHFDGDKVLSESHPFTISSAPNEDHLRLTVKACGDWTGYLYENIKTGAHAHIEGPYGMFNYKSGGEKQVWIAGGIGVTPFLSFVRDLTANPEKEIDLFYTVTAPAEALCLDELEVAAKKYPNLRLHISYSTQDGRLSVKKVVETSGPVAGKHVYMCGPFPMIHAFRQAFLSLGLPVNNLNYEEFNFR